MNARTRTRPALREQAGAENTTDGQTVPRILSRCKRCPDWREDPYRQPWCDLDLDPAECYAEHLAAAQVNKQWQGCADCESALACKQSPRECGALTWQEAWAEERAQGRRD